MFVVFQARYCPVAITAFYLQGNNAPYCDIYEQKPRQLNEEKVTKSTEYGNRRCGLKVVTSLLDFWRINVAGTSKFTLACIGLSVADKVNRVGLGVALLDGRRLFLGVSGWGVSVFWDLSLIFCFSDLTFRYPEMIVRRVI